METTDFLLPSAWAQRWGEGSLLQAHDAFSRSTSVMAAQMPPFLQLIPGAADGLPSFSPSKPKLAQAAFPPAANPRAGRVLWG